MKAKRIHKLIVKYITASISAEELDELEVKLKKPANDQLFNDCVDLNYRLDSKMKNYDTEKSKRLLLDRIKKDKGVLLRFNFQKIMRYAAVVMLSMTLGFFINEELSNEPTAVELTPKENFVTLELEDGNIKVISEDGSSQVMDSEGNVIGSQVGGKLHYANSNNATPGKEQYNTLHVPYGKHFELKLSDGTVAYLNSGSSLKYPVKFIKGKERRVYLTGEAFLEVAKDTENPFIVSATDLSIRVFGTKFNVSAYAEDEVKEVVLVEGSVGMYRGTELLDDEDGTVLSPGIKGSYDNAQGSITTQPVVTSIYTSWVKGVLVFRNTTFDNILKKLERHYDVEIVNKNSKLTSATFNASFGEMPIYKILDYFKGEYGIDYRIINDNQIIVN